MALFNFNDTANIRAPKPWDERTGYWDTINSVWAIYGSREDALSALTYRFPSQTVPVMENDQYVEYWFVGGTEDEHFIKKGSDSYVFENGLVNTDGTVKLGGLITDTTFLFFGGGYLSFDPTNNIFEVNSNPASGVRLTISGNDNRMTLGKTSNNLLQALMFTESPNNDLVIRDDIHEKGLGDLGDYSANKTQYSYVTLKMLQDSIPDLTGYATEQWVLDQGYLTEFNTGWNVNTGNLTLGEDVYNLDGRWMLRSNTITSGYGIIASADFTDPVSIQLDTDTLDQRYLRKDTDDSNNNNILTTGYFINNTAATFNGGIYTPFLPQGSITDQMLVYDPVDERVKYIEMPNFGGTFNVANNAGTLQFSVGSGETLRFNATGDASVAFNAGTKTITINSSGGSTGGGVDSWNARTGDVVPEDGDYTSGQITETTNLYFTEARARGTVLTGLSTLNVAITATDTILQALGKAQGQINARVPTSRTLAVNGTAGNITVSGGVLDLSANRAWTVNLATVGTAGTYTKVTTDSFGRVVSGTTLAASDIPSLPYVTTNTTQSGLSGDKTWTGIHTFNTLAANSGQNSTFTSPGSVALKGATNNPFVSFHANDGSRIGYVQVNSTSGMSFGSPNGYRFFDLGGTGTQMVVVDATGVLSRQAINGHTHTWSQLSGGSTALIPGAGAGGQYGSLDISGSKGNYSGIRFTGTANNWQFMVRNSDGLSGVYSETSGWKWQFDGSGALAEGTVPWPRLTGHPSITAGNGLTGGGTLAATRTITLGTPSTITGSTTNSVSATSHTHALTLASADITGALGFTPVTNARTISAGTHLTGGGNLTANRSLALQFTTNAYATDNQNNGRLYFGNTSADPGDNFILRLSHSAGRFTFRNSGNAHVMEIGPSGHIGHFRAQITSGTTINLALASVIRLPDVSANVTFSVTNIASGIATFCLIRNTSTNNAIRVSITNCILLGDNLIGPNRWAAINIQECIGATVYTVVPQL